MIVIKKRITLEFLGDDYKDAYLNFQSIPLSQYDEIFDQQDVKDKRLYLKFITNILKKYFIDGKFPGLEKLTAEDLEGLDELTSIRCFQIITGQELDPKVETPLTNTSPTVE